MTQRIVDMTVTELSEKLRSRKLSAEEAAKAYLGQMEKREPEVGAYLTVTREAALETARKVDQKRMKGEELHPMAGIPTGIKDNICTKGVKTTCANPNVGKQNLNASHKVFFEVDIPVVQVDKCQGEAERHVGELLAHTHLQVDRHFVVFLIVGFQLSAQVLGDGRNRPFMIRVVIVNSQVNAHSY